jgi:hypothetical protein
MESVEKKVRAKLRLQGMQFAGHERLLILIALALFPSQAFQVFISMARHNNGNVDEDLVGESCPNRFEPCMEGTSQVFLLDVIEGWNQNRLDPDCRNPNGTAPRIKNGI